MNVYAKRTIGHEEMKEAPRTPTATSLDAPRDDVLAWLSAGDPSVVWQVQRDVLRMAPHIFDATQARVATEGFGRALLVRRAKDGTWGGGLYSPKWTSTFYTMRLLYDLGLDGTHPDAVSSCALLLDEGFHADGSIGFWGHDITDCCVNAMMLGLAVRFGHRDDARVDPMVAWLLDAQLHDGGWNCQATRRPTEKGSFHTTLSTLEALLAYGETKPARMRRVASALRAGHDYFLRHRIFRSERSGVVVKDAFTRFSFPVWWHFDALRAVDHFRAAGHPLDERLDDAITLIRQRRTEDGVWMNENIHAGRAFMTLEKAGAPSRFNTLRALRVLAWVDAGGGPRPLGR